MCETSPSWTSNGQLSLPQIGNLFLVFPIVMQREKERHTSWFSFNFPAATSVNPESTEGVRDLTDNSVGRWHGVISFPFSQFAHQEAQGHQRLHAAALQTKPERRAEGSSRHLARASHASLPNCAVSDDTLVLEMSHRERTLRDRHIL